MRRWLLYILSAALAVIVVSIGWWSLQQDRHRGRTYAVVPGDTVASVAAALGVPVTDLAAANAESPDTWTLVPRSTIVVPPRIPGRLDRAAYVLAGLACALGGLLAGYWLALAAGVVPRGSRKAVLGLSFALAVLAYAVGRALDVGSPWMTPQAAFSLATNGFAWATGIALLARAIGIREAPSSGPTDEAPEIGRAAEEPADAGERAADAARGAAVSPSRRR